MMNIENYDNDSAADRASGNINQENKAVNKENNCSNPRSLSELRPNKKSVRFDTEVNVYRLDTPCASDMSSKEKQRMWYNSNEYDQFKYQAAKQAGVKVVRYDTEKVGQNHHFVMVGDFDCKDNKQDASSASTKNTSIDAAKKFYYNENEYSDSHNNDGEAVCKRGLGYHFSRNRKKSRTVTRSAVVAWQKTLCDPSNQSNPKFQQHLPTVGSNLGKLDKSQLMLALVSTKCSRIAREEAKWRGDVDYRVAYPERHDPHAMSSLSVHSQNKDSNPAHGMIGKRDTANNNSSAMKKKRLCDDVGIISRTNNTSCKRQRTNNRGCGGDRDELSQKAIGYLSGVLRAEV